ncbi:MAG: hypothetical protein DDT38_01642 [Firmicutes bacterium]|nr:hypothetical protein [candidate division NPL-UPA2 bacterium]
MALGGVPAKVIIPPRPAAKASGIRSLPRAMPEAAAMPIVTGSSTAVVLVLDNAAESTAASTITAAISPRSLPPASLVKKLPALVATPVENSASPTINMPTKRITEELTKPLNASVTEITRVR